MPLQHIIHINPHEIVGIWHLTESEEYFKPHIPKLLANLKNLKSISHTTRRTEWLAGRWLVYELVQRLFIPFDGIWTDEYNKPHLGAENGSISISHASPYVVAILNTEKPCGIDVEKIRQKLAPLSTKFLNEEELAMADNNLTKLAMLWGAKEALYKLHGRKSLIFKDNLRIEGLTFSEGCGTFSGSLHIDDEHKEYTMVAGKFENYVLVHTV